MRLVSQHGGSRWHGFLGQLSHLGRYPDVLRIDVLDLVPASPQATRSSSGSQAAARATQSWVNDHRLISVKLLWSCSQTVFSRALAHAHMAVGLERGPGLRGLAFAPFPGVGLLR